MLSSLQPRSPWRTSNVARGVPSAVKTATRLSASSCAISWPFGDGNTDRVGAAMPNGTNPPPDVLMRSTPFAVAT